ncbi:isoprenylcysteine carboxylmethyltransferase family protein [Gleimia sp. 6138-11-ORH1]|uniref:methyltransferase family protein n=1 Tax=Gleimia sp. 6138-11-ORH1 TaxID=2973937 RepID=UPI002169326D|nr:isoprenylcysteine carboxylmethyltransferase family protein [Gleimia sp. 6138-11-ORH1]MCS4484124.1 isoprenylcysteine carboxylmethyltransferase family protein [Gleimia sp. 6138-11-ORH1]
MSAQDSSLPVFGVGSVFGVGPVFVAGSFLPTGLATVFWGCGFFAGGQFSTLGWVYALRFLALLLLLVGVFFWAGTVFWGKMVQQIRAGVLMTSGFYAWVRHPLYAGVLLVNCGILLGLANFWVWWLPFLYWGFLTVLLKHTEEKWLLAKFGSTYVEYTHRVNRCWPWFPKRDWLYAYSCDG